MVTRVFQLSGSLLLFALIINWLLLVLSFVLIGRYNYDYYYYYIILSLYYIIIIIIMIIHWFLVVLSFVLIGPYNYFGFYFYDTQSISAPMVLDFLFPSMVTDAAIQNI